MGNAARWWVRALLAAVMVFHVGVAAAAAPQEDILFKVDTLGAVENRPTTPTSFTLAAPALVTRIRTYHWNHGHGSALGTVALRDQGGQLLGQWKATGEPGMGGAPNAYWDVRPNLELPAGTFTVFDSDPGTWSHNRETGGRGIATIFGRKAGPARVPDPAPGRDGVSLRLTRDGKDQTLSLGGKVTVTVPPGAVDSVATLTIASMPQAPPIGWNALQRGEAYDISVPGRTRFDRPLTLEFAYDPARVPPGANPATNVAAAYFDEASRAWVVAPCRVDAARKRVIVRSNHLCGWCAIYQAGGWGAYESRHFNIVFKPGETIVYLNPAPKGVLVPVIPFVQQLGQWLDQAYEAYEQAGFDMPGVTYYPDRKQFQRFPASLRSRIEDRPWVFVGAASSYTGAMVDEAQWDLKTGNILFPTNYDSAANARQDACHELFHAVQNTYLNIASMAARRWWIEATADYAGAHLGAGIAGRAPMMGANLKPRYLERCLTYCLPRDRGGDPHSFHDYSTSHFVEYLVSRGASFKAMWDATADPSLVDLLQVLDPLDKYLQKTFGATHGLAAFYTDFAKYFLFDPASPLPLAPGATLRDVVTRGNDTLAPGQAVSYRFEQQAAYTATLWSIRLGWDAAHPSRTVKISTLHRDPQVALFLYRLPGGRRLGGGGGSEGELGTAPRTLTLPQDDQLFVLAVRTGDGSLARAEVRVEDLAAPTAKKPPTPAGRQLRLDLQLQLYVSYTRGFKDDEQTWPHSGFQGFENRDAWRCFVINEGDTFSGYRMDGDKDSWVEGRRTADRIVELKWKNRLVSKHGTTVYRIEEWTIELADIPVQPHDPKEFILEGRDLETGKPTPGFRDHIRKLEHKVTFYPSKATAELAEVFYERSEVKTMKDLNGFGLLGNRPYIRVYFSSAGGSR